MSVSLIFIVSVMVIAIGVKVHRGTFFRWGNEKHDPRSPADERDVDGLR